MVAEGAGAEATLGEAVVEAETVVAVEVVIAAAVEASAGCSRTAAVEEAADGSSVVAEAVDVRGEETCPVPEVVLVVAVMVAAVSRLSEHGRLSDRAEEEVATPTMG